MSIITDENKIKLEKLLKDVDTPEVKLTERCYGLVKEFRKRFQSEIDKEEEGGVVEEIYENPYIVDKGALELINKKLKEIRNLDRRRAKESTSSEIITSSEDPTRPWRTNSSKEKLVRINNELKRHKEKNSEMINPLSNEEIQQLIRDCKTEGESQPAVSNSNIRDAVDGAKKNLPNFQYIKIENSTATGIFPTAHGDKSAEQLEPTQIVS